LFQAIVVYMRGGTGKGEVEKGLDGKR
jgi:hypothetical protein